MPEESFPDIIRGVMNSGSALGWFLQVLPVTLFIGLIYTLYLLVTAKKENGNRMIVRVLFVCYLTGLVNLLIVPADFWLRVYDGIMYGWWNEVGPFFSSGYFNVTPALFKWLSGSLTIGSWVKQMLVGNLLIFVPLGVFLPLVTEKINGKSILKTAVIIPLVVEVLQLTVGRSFDTDDLICNFLGIMIGYYSVSWLKNRKYT